jgi:hypothetical protein
MSTGNEVSSSQGILADSAGQPLPVNTSQAVATANTLDANSQQRKFRYIFK